jgi:hypothetical protein
MARGSKASYTNKQKRKAGHIEKGYEKKGRFQEDRESAGVGDREQAVGRREKEEEKEEIVAVDEEPATWRRRKPINASSASGAPRASPLS